MQGGDVRTPDKLVNHVISDDSARNSWLAPIIPNTVSHFRNYSSTGYQSSSVCSALKGLWLAHLFHLQANKIYVVFDIPVTVSMIKLFNYSKTPNRGVREFGVSFSSFLTNFRIQLLTHTVS